jgi:signal transduction protein with GAF and PtsI domain
MPEIGRGIKVFDAAPVRGTLRWLEGPDDVLALMDTGAEGVVAGVRDAGATFLAPLYHELTGIVCTSGTPRSHIGIVSREFQVPCSMDTTFATEPADGTTVDLDCSGAGTESVLHEVPRD